MDKSARSVALAALTLAALALLASIRSIGPTYDGLPGSAHLSEPTPFVEVYPDLPACEEDQVLVGIGEFADGYWTDYACGPAVDDVMPEGQP